MGIESDGASGLKVYPPEQYAFDGKEFKKVEPPVSIMLGDEVDLREGLAQMGFPSDLIEALMSGNTVQMITQESPFGRIVVDEKIWDSEKRCWRDKDNEKRSR